MHTGVITIVGNVFEEFARKAGALTANDAASLPDDALPVGSPEGSQDLHLVFGQGVTADEAFIAVEKFRNVAHASNFHQIVNRAGRQLSHKHKNHNTLIGVPERVGEGLYAADLLIDERSELMGDHQTGLHIQGMLQVEGFRQMMLAVFEKFYPLDGGVKAYAVINNLDTSFASFMFPLPATIECTVTELNVNDRRTRLGVRMRALQNGQECSTCATTFTFYPASVIALKEAELAVKAIDATRRAAAAEDPRTSRTLRRLAPVSLAAE